MVALRATMDMHHQYPSRVVNYYFPARKLLGVCSRIRSTFETEDWSVYLGILLTDLLRLLGSMYFAIS